LVAADVLALMVTTNAACSSSEIFDLRKLFIFHFISLFNVSPIRVRSAVRSLARPALAAGNDKDKH
jgi:hypothetical protein